MCVDSFAQMSRVHRWRLRHHICDAIPYYVAGESEQSFIRDCCEGKKRVKTSSLSCVDCIEQLCLLSFRTERTDLTETLLKQMPARYRKTFLETISEGNFLETKREGAACHTLVNLGFVANYADVLTAEEYTMLCACEKTIRLIRKFHPLAPVVAEYYYVLALQTYYKWHVSIAQSDRDRHRTNLTEYLVSVFRETHPIPYYDTLSILCKGAYLAEVPFPEPWFRRWPPRANTLPKTLRLLAAVIKKHDIAGLHSHLRPDTFVKNRNLFMILETVIRILFWTGETVQGMTWVINMCQTVNLSIEGEAWMIFMGFPDEDLSILANWALNLHHEHMYLCAKYSRAPYVASLVYSANQLTRILSDLDGGFLQRLDDTMPELSVLTTAQMRQIPSYASDLRIFVALAAKYGGNYGDILHVPRAIYQALNALLIKNLTVTVIEYAWILPITAPPADSMAYLTSNDGESF
jgi:hypothetical protein